MDKETAAIILRIVKGLQIDGRPRVAEGEKPATWRFDPVPFEMVFVEAELLFGISKADVHLILAYLESLAAIYKCGVADFKVDLYARERRETEQALRKQYAAEEAAGWPKMPYIHKICYRLNEFTLTFLDILDAGSESPRNMVWSVKDGVQTWHNPYGGAGSGWGYRLSPAWEKILRQLEEEHQSDRITENESDSGRLSAAEHLARLEEKAKKVVLRKWGFDNGKQVMEWAQRREQLSEEVGANSARFILFAQNKWGLDLSKVEMETVHNWFANPDIRGEYAEILRDNEEALAAFVELTGKNLMLAEERDTSSEQVVGWETIACGLGKSSKTARRWHKEGLLRVERDTFGHAICTRKDIEDCLARVQNGA